MEGLEIAKALEEAQELVGARLSKVHQIGEVFFLRFFDPPGALALDPKGKAFHRTELRPLAPPKPPAFCQLLRALVGQPLLALEQAGFDRVVRLRFPEADLILDLRPRAGNLFFFGRDGKREALREGAFQEIPFGPGDPVAGLGPGLRRALFARLGQEPSETELREFAEELLRLPPKGFLYRAGKGLKASFFPGPDFGEPLQEFPAFWEALDRVLEERVCEDLAKARIEELERELERKKRALSALARAEEEAQGWRALQEKADLILARLLEIPRGAPRAVVEGFDGNPVEIELDPAFSPQEYAQVLYRQAQKMRRTLAAVPARRAALEGETARIAEEIELLRARPDLAPFLVFRKEEPEKAKEKEPPAQPRQYRIGGFTVLVGRSAKENDWIVRRASPNDIWLHARGVPGAHVLIRSGGRRVPEEVLIQAAKLAAWHSKARGERKVEVSYTEARYVKKPKGSPPGMVTLLREEVLVVSGEEAP
ncbi:MAG: NFACT RNA binding domain-containing protein [Candidatus Bipolaricaulaceae bacterium]